MPIPVPNLDDRKFQELVDEAKRRIPRYAPSWTDHNVSDPGITLIELFAWMTEQYLFRLNQVPDKNFVTFLNLIGASLEPAKAAKGSVTFTLGAAPTEDRRVIIPAWTEVATERTETKEAIVFTTDAQVEALAPKFRWMLTTADAQDYKDQSPSLRDEVPFDIWGTPPAAPQSLYLGFEQDLSAHTLALQFQCDKVAIGIDPQAPPWLWEVWRGNERKWEPLDIAADTTAGLNQNGEVRLYLPPECQPLRLPPYEAATVVRSSPVGNPGLGRAPYARSPRVRRVGAYAAGITASVTHAQPVGPEVLGVSSGQPGQNFRLQHRDILKPEGPNEVVQVSTPDGGWETWAQVADFGDSTSEDKSTGKKHYLLDPLTGEVEFGPVIRQRDGTEPQFGAIPPLGSTIRILRYRIGGGVKGNVAEGRIRVLKTTLPYVASVVNREPITGGEEAQSIEDAKLRAPSRLRTRFRAVTAEDYEYLSQEVEGVGRVRCLQPRPDDPGAPPAGTVTLLVIPNLPPLRDSELDRYIDLHESLAKQDQRLTVEAQLQNELRLPEGTRLRLGQFLDDRRLLTTRVEIREPQYVWVTVQTRIRAQAKAEPERVRRDVKIALYQFLHPLFGGADKRGWTFGQPLTIDKVYALIHNIPGVEYATELNLYPIDIANPKGQRLGQSAQVIPVPANAVIVSYYHNVYLAQ